MVLFCKNSLTLFQFYKCYGGNSKRAAILKDAKKCRRQLKSRRSET